MKVFLPGTSSLVPLLAAAALAAPTLAQGDIFDIDAQGSGGLRVLAASKGLFLDSGLGFLQPTAWVSSASVPPPRVAAIDPFDSSSWLGVGRTSGDVLRIGRVIANGQDVAFTEISNSGIPTDLDYAPDAAGVMLMARRSEAGLFSWAIRSANGGVTWDTTFNNGPVSITQIAFDQVLSGRVVAFTEAGDVKLSFNGGQNWSNPVANLGDEVISAVGSPHAEGLFFAATDGKKAWRSEDGGFTWTQLPVQALKIAVSTEVPGVVWITDPNGDLRMSADAGASWSDELDLPGFGQGKVPTDLVFDSARQEVVAVGDSGAYGDLFSAVERVGFGTQGSGGVRPRILLGAVLEPGNDNFALMGDHCVSGGVVIQWASRSEASLPLFGGIVSVGGPILLEAVTVAKSSDGTQGVAGAGEFRIKAPLPSNPAIVGAKFMSQFAVVDAGAANSAGVVLSPALKIVGLP